MSLFQSLQDKHQFYVLIYFLQNISEAYASRHQVETHRIIKPIICVEVDASSLQLKIRIINL
jgi:hypothetical protein